MESIELLNPDQTASGVLVCGKCRRVWGYKDGAERCCSCRICGKHIDCSKVIRFTHDECQAKENAERELKLIQKAEVVDQWWGWVFVENIGYQDGYFRSMDELLEYLEDREDVGSRPEFAFLCKEVRPRFPDVDDIISHIADDMYEDMADDLVGCRRLQKELRKFALKNRKLIGYEPDYKHVIAVPAAEKKESA